MKCEKTIPSPSERWRYLRQMGITWDEIIDAINGRVVYGRTEGFFAGVSTDTRTVKAGELFIALRGKNFDGHDFVETALQNGACGAIVSSDCGLRIEDFESKIQDLKSKIIIQVDDTLNALGDVAKIWRERHPIPVVAITGSNGKTTTKEMAASILSRRYRVLKTEGNLNNLIGLPLMVMKISDSHEVAVLELGMNAFGEVKRLSEICKPDIALITNIGSGHLEGVGSIEGVARAKGEILSGLNAEGTLVGNLDDRLARGITGEWKGKVVTFAVSSPDADVKGSRLDPNCHGDRMKIAITIKGHPLTAELMSLGLHNVYNAAAAAAVAAAMGFDREEIRKGLEEWRPFKGRFELFRLESGVNLVDDTYNANPDSAAAALRTLAEMKGANRGFAVLGDMLELGAHAEDAHYDLGKKVAACGLDYLLLLGPLSSDHTARGARDGGMDGERVIVLIDHSEAIRRIKPMLRGGDWVLVKGSRGMAMEKVVEGIKEFRVRGS